MAAAAAAVPHQIPPFHLPQVPRVRPPRMLPGTPSPNTNPQPPGPVPQGEVWVQGKWRNQASNAAKQHQHVLGQRVKRALKHHTHGMDIYAYKHIRSSQVVYSLARNMESGQIMPQLVFHGKKTVPAALRRDVWRPYFAVHFPETPAGARAGLTAYQRLREFAMRRQLDPPRDLLITTEEDVQKRRDMAGDPVDVREKLMSRNMKLPMVGQLLPKKLRAQKLMDQKATSVADLAFVLSLARNSLKRLEKEARMPREERERRRFKLLGRRGRRRLRAIRGEEEEQQKEIAWRQTVAETVDVNEGKMPLDKNVAKQLSIEYDGAVADSNRVIRMADIDRAKNPSEQDSHDIQVLWADIRDGTYAASWPDGIYHGELQPVVTSKRAVMRVRQREMVDDDGVVIEEQKGPVSVITGSSPHIIGREKSVGYQPFQQVLQEQDKSSRQTGEAGASRFEEYEELRTFRAARKNHTATIDEFEQLISTPQFVALSEREDIGEYLNPEERSILSKFQRRQSNLLAILTPLRQLEMKHPERAAMEDRFEYWDLINNPHTESRLKGILRSTAEATVTLTEAEIESLELPDEVVERQREIMAIEEKIERAQNNFDDLSAVMNLAQREQGQRLHLTGQIEQKLQRAQKELEDLEIEKTRLEEAGLENAVVGAIQEETLDTPHLAQMETKGIHEADEATAEDEPPSTKRDAAHPADEENLRRLMKLLKQLDDAKAAILVPKTMLEGKRFAAYATFTEESRRLQAVMEEREKEIENLVKEETKEAGEKEKSLNIEQALDQAPATEPDEGKDVSRVNLEERLPKLRELQEEDQVRLSTMQQEARDEFVNSEVDVSGFLPHSWRNPKYWPEDDEAESTRRYEQAEADMRREREEEVKREESRGFFSRIGGWFSRRKV